MGRLYDRMMRGDIAVSQGGEGIFEASSPFLPDATVVDVSNVAKYFASSMDGMMLTKREVPNLAPPFPHCWFEFKCPWHSITESKEIARMLKSWSFEGIQGAFPMPSRIGVLMIAGDTKYDPETVDATVGEFFDLDQIRWSMSLFLYLEYGKGKPIEGPKSHLALGIEPDGKLTGGPDDDLQAVSRVYGPVDQKDDVTFNFATTVSMVYIAPALLAINFMHCKNVSLDENVPPQKASRKHERKHGQPLTKYYTLAIEPMGQTAKHNSANGEGFGKSLHICRGHFATYTEEKPLFGRVTGTFWKSQHVRGSKQYGEVVKDYAVKSPK